jgi:hypothetical protein
VIIGGAEFFSPFDELLKSAIEFIPENPASTLFDLLHNFLQRWRSSNFQRDLFLLNGERVCSKADSDLVEALGVKDLVTNGRHGDVTRLWEAAVLEEKVLVLGSTPRRASKAALAISSFTFPECRSFIPYVTVTDPRFPRIESHGNVVGTANPIAAAFCEDTFKIFRVGFQREVGFGPPQLGCRVGTRNELKADSLHGLMAQKTADLRCAVNGALDRLMKRDFLSVLLGKIDVMEVARAIDNLRLSVPTTEFAAKFVRTTFFDRMRREVLTSPGVLSHLVKFDAVSVCNEKTDAELRKICRGFARAIEIVSQESEIRHEMNRKLKILRPRLTVSNSKTGRLKRIKMAEN